MKKFGSEMCGEHEAKIEHLIKWIEKWDARFWIIISFLAVIMFNAVWDRVKSIPFPVASAQASPRHR